MLDQYNYQLNRNTFCDLKRLLLKMSNLYFARFSEISTVLNDNTLYGMFDGLRRAENAFLQMCTLDQWARHRAQSIN